MRSTLFHIPNELFGIPLFGVGLLLAVWAVVCVGRIGYLVYRRGFTSEVWAELPMMLLIGAVITWALPALCDAQGLPLRGYGVMVFLGVAGGVALAVYRAAREGFDPELIYSLALWTCVAGVVCARMFYIIEYWDDYRRPTIGATIGAIANYTKGGLVVYGAFLGGLAASIMFFVRHKLPVLKFLDLIVPSVMLGLALGRIGCFLNGCCYGGTCDLPWAVTFPGNPASTSASPSPPYISQASRGQFVLHGIHFERSPIALAVVQSIDEGSPVQSAGLKAGDEIESIEVELPGHRPMAFPPDDSAKLTVAGAIEALTKIEEPGTKATFHVLDVSGKSVARNWQLSAAAPIPARSLPVHPTQLYSAIGALLLTLFLLAWYPFRRHDGEVTALVFTIYPIMRIFEEIIRNDEPLNWTRMTISQDVSVLLLAAAVTIWIFALRGPRLKYATS
jgi:phosphatidylglycerol:prolipoprotein diacylglycerol transferase